MSKRIILGVLIPARNQKVPEVQKVLTEYGCNIKTRLGLHEVSESVCSPNGLLILETLGGEQTILELQSKLAAIEGVQVQRMAFEE